MDNNIDEIWEFECLLWFAELFISWLLLFHCFNWPLLWSVSLLSLMPTLPPVLSRCFWIQSLFSPILFLFLIINFSFFLDLLLVASSFLSQKISVKYDNILRKERLPRQILWSLATGTLGVCIQLTQVGVAIKTGRTKETDLCLCDSFCRRLTTPVSGVLVIGSAFFTTLQYPSSQFFTKSWGGHHSKVDYNLVIFSGLEERPRQTAPIVSGQWRSGLPG